MTTNETNEDLWKKLDIQFILEGEGFPDDKIYGYIDVNPPSSRRLIKLFKLFIDDDKKKPIEFDSRFELFSASGFTDSGKTLRELYIEAIPNEIYRNVPAKVSNVCSFFFNGVRSFFNPTLRFKTESINGKSETVLVIRWKHVGDEDVQKYRLFLDDVEIHEIGLDSISDTFEVSIRHWKVGESHSIQIVGFRNNRKETYRSDLLKFVVPDGSQDEVICVSNDPIPPSLIILLDPVGSNKGVKPVKKSPPEPKVEKKGLCFCGSTLPHDTFPGIDHYFKLVPDKISSKNEL